jgi:hypothetical protein
MTMGVHGSTKSEGLTGESPFEDGRRGRNPMANSALHRTWSRKLADARVRYHFACGSKPVSLDPLCGRAWAS